VATKDEDLDKMLKKLRELLVAGRTAGRQKLWGGTLFWTLAQSRTRESRGTKEKN